MKKTFLLILMFACCFMTFGCAIEEVKEEKQPEEKVEESNIGSVEEKTVATLLSQLNKMIIDNSGLGPVEGEATKKNGLYWYPITDGIQLVVLPLDEQKSEEEDIVRSMRIYVDKKYAEDPQVAAYAALLIRANNEEITMEEAQKLVEDAIQSSEKDVTSHNGKGISVGYLKADDHEEYQVIRNYQ